MAITVAHTALMQENTHHTVMCFPLKQTMHLARQRLVPVTGPMLQEEALIARSLGINDFKASNGWLQRFKDLNNKQLVVSGESGDVNQETVTAWRGGLLHLYME